MKELARSRAGMRDHTKQLPLPPLTEGFRGTCRMHLSVVRALQRVEGEEFNCVCGDVLHKADASMLHCDTCDDCALSNGVLSLNEDAYSEVHVTRRPSSSMIIEFLKSSRSIPCRMEEVVIMENLISSLQDWRDLLSAPFCEHRRNKAATSITSLH